MLENHSSLISMAVPSSCEQESDWVCVSYDILSHKRPLSEQSEDDEEEEERKRDCRDKRRKALDLVVDNVDYTDLDELIISIGRDISIYCLLHCSRSDYGSIASLNQSFRSLLRSGELYKLRRKMGITEPWIYFSCNVLEWVAYDPYRSRWITLPRMPPNECFMCSDKESLAVGTELLVFGKEVTSHILFRYSILTNSWSRGKEMNFPRCLFGSASLGEKAIIAGGTDTLGNILNSAELYNSELQAWETLPSMNKARKMCSGVFLDGKFYVIGGMASNTEVLACGEEYDPVRRVWRVIPNMSSGLNGANGAPPLVAAVNNELYAADYASKEVRKYDKVNNSWITLGQLPGRPSSVNGWGLAFRACGERLIVIGGPRWLGGGMIELNSWIPNKENPEWNMIASKHSGSFVYNCAVMSC
ncbi:hypothetical protein M5K25_017918 [Dendrobium thyrsiflorum]|uniref:F-box/kelch-repeat protein n=1 Tax=Dendrobium thyrsiflorum TaxID=117978 RepID=A0ABD0UH40_DENTH